MHSIDSMYYFLSFSIENYLWNEINFTDSMLGSIARETELIIVNYKCMTTKCTAGEYCISVVNLSTGRVCPFSVMIIT